MDFKLNLSYESWDNIFLDDDVNVIFNNFLNTYLRIYNPSLPAEKFLVKSNTKPWLTTGIRTSCLRKKELYLLTKHNNDPELLNDYKLYCKILSQVITAAKKSCHNKCISASVNRTRAAWNAVKMLTGNKYNHNKITHMNINEDLTDNYQLIVNSFNKYFSTITDKIVSEIPQYSDSMLQNMNPLNYLHEVFSQPFPQMQLKSTCINEPKETIKSLKTKDSCGYDEISNKTLKVSMPFIVSPLTYICNKSLATGEFPAPLKYVEARPLLKRGRNTELSNFRPISVLTSFSKIFERIIYDRLYQHLNYNNILVNEHFGFIKDSSTSAATHKLLKEILDDLNNNSLVGGTFCDIGKVFDCVNHDLLLSKMEFYGIRGITNRLIRSYLSNRYQRVSLNKNSNKIFFILRINPLWNSSRLNTGTVILSFID
jgi:hypothetical protein